MTQEEFNKVYDVIKDINWNNADDKTSESLFEKILENASEVNGIRIADYLLENGEFAKPQKICGTMVTKDVHLVFLTKNFI